MDESKQHNDMAALAKGGRTNFMGFLLRLAARIPFILIAGRLYGEEAMGRFAPALVTVELVAYVCALGEKRGLAQRMSESDDHGANIIFDSVIISIIFSSLAVSLLWLFPQPLFPSGHFDIIDKLVMFAIPGYALTEIFLAAQAYKYDVKTTVRARAIVEPWTISILAGVFYVVLPQSGLEMAYLASIYAGLITAGYSMLKTYGLPKGWRPRPRRMAKQTLRALPLALADAVEWGTRRVDILILGYFASPAAVGIYYAAQQVASLPQKLKTSFEPILSPVITRNLKENNHKAIAEALRQVGFWIIAAQAGIALALGIPGEGVMGLFGPNFVGGTGALAFLLLAEVVAATAVVSESALVYMARVRNLWISVATIVVQAALTAGFISAVSSLDKPEPFKAGAAALALALSLAMASLVKAWLLSRLLGHGVNNWRMALVWGSAPAIVVGYIFTYTPEWVMLIFGIPSILFTYGWVIWHKGFQEDDRVLFRKNLGVKG